MSEGTSHWFEALADHMGPAYLRYSFTMGTAQEVEFLLDVLGLEPGMRVLDVGCGPGRHVLALAARGIEAVGVDISQRFVDLGNAAATEAGLAGATFQRGDARALTFDTEFDAAISLCQGAFGLSGPPADGPARAWAPAAAAPERQPATPAASGDESPLEQDASAGHRPTEDPGASVGPTRAGASGGSAAPLAARQTSALTADPNNLANDGAVLDGIRRALRPGAPAAISAFSAYFQVRWLEEHDRFDAATAVNHEPTEVRDEHGRAIPADLWTTCYTPRELRMLAERQGLVVDDIWSVSPGEYAANRADLDHHEFLVRLHRAS